MTSPTAAAWSDVRDELTHALAAEPISPPRWTTCVSATPYACGISTGLAAL